MGTNVTDALRDRIERLSSNCISDVMLEESVRLALADYVAVANAGRCCLAEDPAIDPFLRSLLKGGSSSRAFAYGACAHWLELDDGYRKGGIHVGAPVISALLAARLECEWRDVVRAVVCGYEAAGLLAASMQPSHKRRGFHITGTCGCVGAAVAVAVAEGQGREQLKRTISAAAGMASGLLEMQEDGSKMKPLTAGNAASNGVRAAEIGRTGLPFPDDALGGLRGLMSCMSDSAELASLAEPCVVGVYRKVYPSCRHGHSAIDAANILRKQLESNCCEIASIEIETYKDAIFGHDLTDISTSSQGMMSTPYCVATMLNYGRLELRSFEEGCRKDAETRRLMGLVSMREDAAFSSAVPAKRGARVTIALQDGRTKSCEVWNPKGEPENPLSKEELADKCIPLLEMSGRSHDESQDLFEALYSGEMNLTEIESETFELGGR